MKKLLLSLLFILFSAGLYSQSYIYGNEWINYSQKYLKIKVAAQSVYRIDYSTLSTALYSAFGEDISAIDPRNFQLYYMGEEQYIYIDGENDGVFDATDYIEFYGNKNDGSLDTRLYDNPDDQIATYASIYNDTAIYFLTWNSIITNNRVEVLANDITGAPAVQEYFKGKYILYNGYAAPNYFIIYFSPGRPYSDVYESKFDAGEGYADYSYSDITLDKSMPANHLYSGTAFTPQLKTAVITSNEVDHHYSITFNGETLQDTSLNGYSFTRYLFNLDNVTESNTLAYSSLNGSTDYMRNCYAELTYPQTFDFNDSSKINITLNDNYSPSKYIELTNYNDKSTQPVLYDLTDNKRMLGIVEGGITKYKLPYDATSNQLFITSQDVTDIQYITSLTPVNFINYQLPANQGDYLIISHPAVHLDALGIDRVQEYADYRSSLAGGSYNVKIEDINLLYDEFSYGVRYHPLAIRNFALFAKDSFSIEPRYVFLLGKSVSYDWANFAGATFPYNYVPTFGQPGSDELLMARPGNIKPEIAVGRLVAYNGDDIKKYFDKVVEYEAVQADPVQTIENKAWMKNVLHFAGGSDFYEQSLFNNFLTQYAGIIADTLYGGNVKQFNKVTTDPILYSTSEYIDSIINAGVSLITFFGHSSTGSFDYNVGEPEDFNNAGKYFVVFGNGCNTAAIHGEDPTLGERYMLTENKAAVAFIAASSFSLAASLHTYALKFYAELGRQNYPNGLGDIIKAVNDSLNLDLNVYDRITAQHTTLQGDPALKLNSHPKPDYAIEPPSVFFEPGIITTGVDSFKIKIVITNLGRAIDTSYNVEVKRTKPGGIIEDSIKRFHAAYFRDTVTFSFLTDNISGVGLNDFYIQVDKDNEISELDEMNNIINTSTNIISDDAIPVYPYEYSIMNTAPPYLAASTSNVFASANQYIIEIDTTELFNSPLKKSQAFYQSGGVLYWNNPPITWIPNTVYYWQVSLDSVGGNDYLWRKSSFIYLPGSETGWNQSHYFQYLNNQYNDVLLKPDRTLDFVPNLQTYEVATGIYPTTDWTEVTSYINGELQAVGSCASAGLVVLVGDAETGLPWTTQEVGTTNTGPYGDIYCSGDAYENIIQFNTNDLASRTALYNFMTNTVSDSSYFICYSNNYAEFNEWAADSIGPEGQNLFDAFVAYGATDILSLATYDYDRSYIFGAKKGAPSTKFELIGDEAGDKIEATFNVPGKWDRGNVETPAIGPANAWDKIKWQISSTESPSYDVNGIDLIGITASGTADTLVKNLQSGDTTINWVNAVAYPYIKLKLNTLDDSMRTPAQIDYWRAIFTPVPEAAINANKHFVFNTDTIYQGDNLQFEVAIDNVSKWNMDSLLINYSIKDANNVLHQIPYTRQDSLLSFQSMVTKLNGQITQQIPAGKATFIINVNPDNDQPEQYHFNNIGYLPIYIAGDNSNPLLDVTFDGVHILDGDIVSAKPTILISLKDDSKVLALNDTSDITITLKYPDATVITPSYNGTIMKFYPADTANLQAENTARVELNPELLQDGIYELQVHGQDASGNDAGAYDYIITFEVINKPMISNVLTYPNPFTTQTHFVFTITGSEVPDYLKIQIYTVSGKVIKEIMGNELGYLHVGNNITEYMWDATDQYGDPVANGLYLYRVTAKLNGKKLDKFNTGTDQYFKSDFGKMYLAR